MTMRNPAEFLDDILTGTGLRAYLAECREDNMHAYDALMQAAAELEAAIIKAGGMRFGLGFDVKIIARRITKPIRHAANLHLEAAKAEGTAWAVYAATLGAPAKKEKGRVFDPSK